MWTHITVVREQWSSTTFLLSLYSPLVCQDLICDARWLQLSCHNQRKRNDEAPPVETFTVCISGDNKEDHLLLSFVLYCSMSLVCFEFLLVFWQYDVMGHKMAGLGDGVGEGTLVSVIFYFPFFFYLTHNWLHKHSSSLLRHDSVHRPQAISLLDFSSKNYD